MLSKIQLPEIVISELYKQPLIQQEKENVHIVPVTAKPEAAPGQSYKYLGKNSKHILIIVRFPNEVFLPEEHLNWITRMLDACKLNLADVAIINDAILSTDIEKLKVQFRPQHVLLFGVEPVDIKLPISFPPFREQEYAGCIYLFTPPPDELNEDTQQGKLLKSKLWLCLQKMFRV